MSQFKTLLLTTAITRNSKSPLLMTKPRPHLQSNPAMKNWTESRPNNKYFQSYLTCQVKMNHSIIGSTTFMTSSGSLLQEKGIDVLDEVEYIFPEDL